MLRVTLALICLIFYPLASTHAADQNGYTAAYECRAGGPQCNVDVVALANRACNQVITPTTPWSSINWSNNTICLQAGDHTSKGALTIPTNADGNASSYKVLRYYRAGDTNDDPWNQASSDRAMIAKLDVQGSHWLVHRLTLDGEGGSLSNQVSGGHNILNRILVQRYNQTMLLLYGTEPNNTVQNSVLRDTGRRPRLDTHCIDTGYSPANARVVNNEIYNCAGDGLQTSLGSSAPGLVIENNDIYQTTALRSDGSGQLTSTGNYACGENAVDLKAGGTASNPLQVIQNRFWGFRWTDVNCGGTGSAGDAVVIHQTNSYGLIQNNIMWDIPYAITAANPAPARYTIVGNLIFNSRHSPNPGEHSVSLAKATSVAVYLNTLIDVDRAISAGSGTSHELRCNVVVASGGSSGTATQFNDNAYYGSPNASEARKIDVSIATRAGGASYSAGQIIRTSSASSCTMGRESACFLYRVIDAGVTTSSALSYCTTLGCTVQDGTALLQAVRGPYTFYRKLRTSPELRAIPYARPYGGAPEVYTCPADYDARAGVGID